MQSFLSLFGSLIICLWIQMSSSKSLQSPIQNDLRNVTWAHAVNSKQELSAALNSSIMMLEADISMGFIIGSSETDPIPIMAHPPEIWSDLSFAEFVLGIITWNAESSFKKGIKLDFKNIEAVEPSLQLLRSLDTGGLIDFEIWLNADILQGPINSTSNPVDPQQFLNLTKTYYPSAMLSLGWTTHYGIGIADGFYEQKHLNEMIDLVLESKLQLPPTYPLRAGLMAQTPVESLLTFLDKIPNSTVTIWGSAPDPLDIDKLNEIIAQLGGNRLYIDLPFSLDP